MNRLQDLSIGIIIFLTIIVAIEFWIATDADEENHIDEVEINNGHIYITHEDLRSYISDLEKNKATERITGRDVYKSVFNGVVRGFLMGMVLSNLEGGVAMSLMLGLINPVILYAERSIF